MLVQCVRIQCSSLKVSGISGARTSFTANDRV